MELNTAGQKVTKNCCTPQDSRCVLSCPHRQP